MIEQHVKTVGGATSERVDARVGDGLRRPAGFTLHAHAPVDRYAAAERAATHPVPFPHGTTVGPIEHTVTDRADTVRIGRVDLAHERMGVVVPVDRPKPQTFRRLDAGDLIEPTVIDRRPTTRP